MKINAFERTAFFLSAVMLVFLYGYGSSVFGWFPGSFLDRAVEQAAGYLDGPRYLAPRIHEREGVRVVQGDRVQPGVTLVSTHARDWDWRPGIKLIDRQGSTLHQWRADATELFAGANGTAGVKARDHPVHGSYLFPNGDVVFNIDHVGIVRLDACGNLLWRLPGAHHSLARTDDGTFWVPISGPPARPTSARYPQGYPGLDRPIHHDRLLHLSEHGEPLDTISVIDLLYRNDLARYLVKVRVTSPEDLLHVNDVESLPRGLADDYPLFEAGDLLLSIRASDLVLVFDPETEIVKWHTADPFVQQHDPDFMPGGWIGVFNNNRAGAYPGTLLGGSKIVALKPPTDSLRVLFPTSASDRFYTAYLGKWQMLDNGNMLLTEGRAGRVLEVAPDGRTVWEWIHEPYDESHAVEVTEGTRYTLTPEDVAAWPCASAGEAQEDYGGGQR